MLPQYIQIKEEFPFALLLSFPHASVYFIFKPILWSGRTALCQESWINYGTEASKASEQLASKLDVG